MSLVDFNSVTMLESFYDTFFGFKLDCSGNVLLHTRFHKKKLCEGYKMVIVCYKRNPRSVFALWDFALWILVDIVYSFRVRY